MRRLEVRYRANAVADLEDIYRFVRRASSNAGVAWGFVGRILQRCRSIGDAPVGGVARDDLAPGLRIVPFERTAAIVYRVLDNAVEIVNVFYGRRHYEALFRGRRSED